MSKQLMLVSELKVPWTCWLHWPLGQWYQVLFDECFHFSLKLQRAYSLPCPGVLVFHEVQRYEVERLGSHDIQFSNSKKKLMLVFELSMSLSMSTLATAATYYGWLIPVGPCWCPLTSHWTISSLVWKKKKIFRVFLSQVTASTIPFHVELFQHFIIWCEEVYVYTIWDRLIMQHFQGLFVEQCSICMFWIWLLWEFYSVQSFDGSVYEHFWRASAISTFGLFDWWVIVVYFIYCWYQIGSLLREFHIFINRPTYEYHDYTNMIIGWFQTTKLTTPLN